MVAIAAAIPPSWEEREGSPNQTLPTPPDQRLKGMALKLVPVALGCQGKLGHVGLGVLHAVLPRSARGAAAVVEVSEPFDNQCFQMPFACMICGGKTDGTATDHDQIIFMRHGDLPGRVFLRIR